MSASKIKLLQHMLLAPAVLSVLITPLAADAADLNIDSVSDYSATLDLEQAKQLLQQVTSVNQFNDVYPCLLYTSPSPRD